MDFSPILLLGICNMLLVCWQLATGKRWIKVSPVIHRRTGILLVVTALAHGGMAVLAEVL